MEVKGQLLSAPDVVTCPDRKKRERMAELLERRRSLQGLLSSRLAELRRICFQEAELTGELPSDFPLDVGEKLPFIRRRAVTTWTGNRKCRSEDEDCQRSKLKKTLFSAALRKHNDEHNTHTQTHHGKRTVHRGCHTDSVRSESSSTSESTGYDESQCRPLLGSSGSPVEVFYHNKRRNSLLCRTEPPEPLPTLKPHPLPPLPPSRSQGSSSSGPSDPGVGGGVGACHRSNSSDSLLDRATPPEERPANGVGGRGHRAGGYGGVLLDLVWSRQNPQTRAPLLSLQAPPPPQGAPPTYRGPHQSEQQRVKVTRTKSCGPFLPVSPGRGDPPHPPLSAAIQPDPHPHLLPPRPPQLHLNQDAQLEEATRSLHKALALEGLRDWYLRNTLGSAHLNQLEGKVGVSKVNRGGALQRRRTTHGVLQQPIYQPEPSHRKLTLPHSLTFHGQPLTGSSLHDAFTTQNQNQDQQTPDQQTLDQPSPGTLV